MALPKTEPIRGFGFVNLLPGVEFANPIGVVFAPGDTNRMFVLEQRGLIIAVDRQSGARQVFLDLRAELQISAEAGLLGLAFHPNFAENGRLFVYRTMQAAGLRLRLSEFRCNPPNATTALPFSEKVLISQLDGLDTHNAGDLQFGPDRYLYLSFGDETPLLEDAHESPQAIDKGFFAGIIRIDVDDRPGNLEPNAHPAVTGNYRVPQDNPFIGIAQFNGAPVDPGKVRTEFYAVGLRNPWRFAFDPFTGKMIAADVGSGAVEEIDIIEPGGNYGWPYLEGSRTNLPGPLPGEFKSPIYEYPHGLAQFEGKVVIGGVVYDGADYPGLTGKYVFADYESGNVWAIDPNASRPQAEWLTGRSGIASFAIDPVERTILTANRNSGKIERLVYSSPDQAQIPEKLDAVGAFSDLISLKPIPTAHSFEVNTPLWSDGAEKWRWVDLSAAEGRIRFAPSGPWEYPSGAVWVKHFELEMVKGVPESRRRIETRFLVKTEDDIYGLTYRWDGSQTNATLVPPQGLEEPLLIQEGGILRTQVWSYPSWDQCRTCHNARAGFSLGFNTHQLNRDLQTEEVTINQLEAFAAKDFFSNGESIVPNELLKLADLDDPKPPVEYKVRSYLEANCVHCHQPGGRGVGLWDARIATPLKDASIVNGSSYHQPSPIKIIAPRDLDNSYLRSRVNWRGSGYQMPPLATSEVDARFVELLTQWIGTMPEPDWISANIGPALAEGAAEQRDGVTRLSSTAQGFAKNSYFFFGREAAGTVEMTARVSLAPDNGPNAEGGIVFRDDLNQPDFAVALISHGDQIALRVFTSTGVHRRVANIPRGRLQWMRLVRTEARVSAWVSTNGADWIQITEIQAQLPARLMAGFMAASGEVGAEFTSAEFSEYAFREVEMLPPEASQYMLPAEIPLQARVASYPPGSENSVAFMAAAVPIGVASGPSWQMKWTNAPAGELQIRAVLQGGGSSVTSAPVTLRLEAEGAAVWLLPTDVITQGNRRQRYGGEFYAIPGVPTRESDQLAVELRGATATVFGASDEPGALTYSTNRIKSQFYSDGDLEIRFDAKDYRVRRGALYFVDWLNLGGPQTVSFWGTDSSVPLAVTNVSAAGPVYLPFVFRAPLTVRIHHSAGQAYLTGVFVDPLGSISAELLEPEAGTRYVQPARVPVTIAAAAPDRELAEVQLWDGDTPIATFAGPPFSVVLTNLYAGEHELRAFARGAYGSTVFSAPVSITVLPPPPTARFLGSDTNTMGTWRGRYGSDGYLLIAEGDTLPPWLSFTPEGHGFFTFTTDTTLPQALLRPFDDSRSAYCFYGAPSFSVRVHALHGGAARVGFYLLDFNDAQRAVDLVAETIDGKILAQQEIRNFALGHYSVWEISGEIRFRLIARTVNAVLSAVFIDQYVTSFDLWRNNVFPPDPNFPQDDLLFTDTDGDGYSNGLEFSLGFDPLRSDDGPAMNMSVDPHGLLITFSFRVRAKDVLLKFERSSDLANWTILPPLASQFQKQNGVDWITYRFGHTGSQQEFIRVTPVPTIAR